MARASRGGGVSRTARPAKIDDCSRQNPGLQTWSHIQTKSPGGGTSGAFVMLLYSPVKYNVYSFGKVSTRVGRRSPGVRFRPGADGVSPAPVLDLHLVEPAMRLPLGLAVGALPGILPCLESDRSVLGGGRSGRTLPHLGDFGPPRGRRPPLGPPRFEGCPGTRRSPPLLSRCGRHGSPGWRTPPGPSPGRWPLSFSDSRHYPFHRRSSRQANHTAPHQPHGRQHQQQGGEVHAARHLDICAAHRPADGVLRRRPLWLQRNRAKHTPHTRAERASPRAAFPGLGT